MRWFVPPPTATAYLSRVRQPGSVFRVSTIATPVPATASTKRRVWVATPQRRASKFSAVRSPARIVWAEPASPQQELPGARALAVAAQRADLAAPEQREHRARDFLAAHHEALARLDHGLDRAVLREHRAGS